MQYSAKTDVIRLVEKLEKCCIRFIHFSSENEHISRTFAEMLGLDTGWNCHISLGTEVMKKTDEQLLDISKPAENSLKIKPSERSLFTRLSVFKAIRSKENFRLRSLIKKKRPQRRGFMNFLDSVRFSSLPDLKFKKSLGHGVCEVAQRSVIAHKLRVYVYHTCFFSHRHIQKT
jgi:hypothetical protein